MHTPCATLVKAARVIRYQAADWVTNFWRGGRDSNAYPLWVPGGGLGNELLAGRAGFEPAAEVLAPALT